MLWAFLVPRGGSSRAVVSEPVDAFGGPGRKVVADEISVARVKNVVTARLVGSSLVLWLLANLRVARWIRKLADKASVAFSREKRSNFPGVASARGAKSGGPAGADVGGAARQQVDLFAEVFGIEALREVGSQKVALLAFVATGNLLHFTNVGGESSVPSDFAVQPGVAGAVIAGLAQFAKLRHVLLQTDSRSPGSMIRVLAVHSIVAFVAGRVETGLALTTHLRCAHPELGHSIALVAFALIRRTKEVDTSARLAIWVESDPVGLEVVVVARGQRGLVASAIGFASRVSRVVLPAHAVAAAGPDTLKIIGITRR